MTHFIFLKAGWPQFLKDSIW